MSTRESHPHICISVCTRERPQMLSRLISSYISLDIPDDVTVSLEVVENGPETGAKQVVESKKTDRFHPVYFHHEPQLGIPFARNRCISIAVEKGADFLAFVDDDEWYAETWLTEIWNYAQKQRKGTVIQGSVKFQLPEDTPVHFYPFFKHAEAPTGTALSWCRSGNVLVPVSTFTKHKLSFDESIPFAGGEDSKLFRAAHSLGVPLISCAEAIVYEEVPPERVNYRWLSTRYFRIGLTMGEHKAVRGRLARSTRTVLFIASSIKHSLIAIGYFALSKKEKQLRSWLKACKKLGKGLGLWGVKINVYRKIEGH